MSNDEKIYNTLKENFFSRNFSQITVRRAKDILFAIYMENEERKPQSDFEIANELGIRPSQVRGLRFDYEQSLGAANFCIEEIFFKRPSYPAPDGKSIQIRIDNMYELEWAKDKLNKRNMFYECSISKDVLTVPFGLYVEALNDLLKDFPEAKKEIDAKLQESISTQCTLEELNKVASQPEGQRQNLTKFILDTCKSTLSEVVTLLASEVTTLGFRIFIAG